MIRIKRRGAEVGVGGTGAQAAALIHVIITMKPRGIGVGIHVL